MKFVPKIAYLVKLLIILKSTERVAVSSWIFEVYVLFIDVDDPLMAYANSIFPDKSGKLRKFWLYTAALLQGCGLAIEKALYVNVADPTVN